MEMETSNILELPKRKRKLDVGHIHTPSSDMLTSPVSSTSLTSPSAPNLEQYVGGDSSYAPSEHEGFTYSDLMQEDDPDRMKNSNLDLYSMLFDEGDDVISFSNNEWSENDDTVSSDDDVDEHDSFDSAAEDDLEWSQTKPLVEHIKFSKQRRMLYCPEESDPVNYFKLICTTSFVSSLVERTNITGHDINDKRINLGKSKKMRTWNDMTVNEFFKFVGLYLYMGIVRMQKLNNYWRTGRLFNMQFVRSCMSRDRFKMILNALQFAPPATKEDKIDRLHKIQPVLDYFEQRMNELYYPSRELSIRVLTVPIQNRFMFRQAKEIKKWGVKLYVLLDPVGIVQKIIVSSGKEHDMDKVPHYIVTSLLGKFMGVGHALFIDNFFTSVNLVKELLRNKIYCTGTLKAKCQGCPKILTNKKFKKGDLVEVFSKEGICVLRWRDKQDFLTISSEYTGKPVSTTTRRGETLEKPEAVVEYDKHLGGLDRADEFLNPLLTSQKTIQWFKKVGLLIIEIMLVNSFNLYKLGNPNSKVSLEDFRLSVIDSLIPAGETAKEKPKATSKIIHFPKFLPTQVNSQKRKQKECRVCKVNSIRKQVIIYCPDCPGEPGLCLETCFKKYHKL